MKFILFLFVTSMTNGTTTVATSGEFETMQACQVSLAQVQNYSRMIQPPIRAVGVCLPSK